MSDNPNSHIQSETSDINRPSNENDSHGQPDASDRQSDTSDVQIISAAASESPVDLPADQSPAKLAKHQYSIKPRELWSDKIFSDYSNFFLIPFKIKIFWKSIRKITWIASW